ncbi:hypothetical protein V1477_015233 [Vespula maculifrons]|uniref:Uncharacterized protein n=1 Tax=Vespula maculifrons TaxID=7453 RepID=A0ABD2BJR2_VESMC
MSTYLIFNQLRIIHPQFRPKSRSSVLEPSQNFSSSKHDRSCLEMFEADGVDSGAICKRGFIHLQFAEKPEAPEAERHLGSRILEHDRSCLEMFEADGVDSGAICKRGFIHLQFAEKPEAPEAERHLERRLFDHAGHAKFRVETPLARGSPTAATSTRWDLGRKHDRSCLEMFEADGVESGAICKRGFIHLQFAEKPEAPEAERHLGSWILESDVSSNGSVYIRLLDANTGRIERTLARVSAGTGVVFSGAIKKRRLFDHAGHAKFRVESPLARGSPDAAASTRWDLGRHDRSCLEMFEADGVDSGAICKRGFIHLQFAEKPEAPEAERHLGSRILEHDRSCLEMFEADGVDSGAICKRGFIHLQFAEKPEAPEAERHLGSRILEHDRSCLEMFEADGVDSGAICKRGFIHLQFAEKPEAPEPAGPQMQQPPRGGTWVDSTCMRQSNMMQVLSGEWLHTSIKFSLLK